VAVSERRLQVRDVAECRGNIRQPRERDDTVRLRLGLEHVAARIAESGRIQQLGGVLHERRGDGRIEDAPGSLLDGLDREFRPFPFHHSE
jgi:hypothetical protein